MTTTTTTTTNAAQNNPPTTTTPPPPKRATNLYDVTWTNDEQATLEAGLDDPSPTPAGWTRVPGRGAFNVTLVPILPRRRGERRSLGLFFPACVSLRPGSLAFNPDTPRRLSTPLLTPFNSTPTFTESLWRYVRIAARLPNKGVRDVAMRVRWMKRKGIKSGAAAAGGGGGNGTKTGKTTGGKKAASAKTKAPRSTRGQPQPRPGGSTATTSMGTHAHAPPGTYGYDAHQQHPQQQHGGGYPAVAPRGGGGGGAADATLFSPPTAMGLPSGMGARLRWGPSPNGTHQVGGGPTGTPAYAQQQQQHHQQHPHAQQHAAHHQHQGAAMMHGGGAMHPYGGYVMQHPPSQHQHQLQHQPQHHHHGTFAYVAAGPQDPYHAGALQHGQPTTTHPAYHHMTQRQHQQLNGGDHIFGPQAGYTATSPLLAEEPVGGSAQDDVFFAWPGGMDGAGLGMAGMAGMGMGRDGGGMGMGMMDEGVSDIFRDNAELATEISKNLQHGAADENVPLLARYRDNLAHASAAIEPAGGGVLVDGLNPLTSPPGMLPGTTTTGTTSHVFIEEEPAGRASAGGPNAAGAAVVVVEEEEEEEDASPEGTMTTTTADAEGGGGGGGGAGTRARVSPLRGASARARAGKKSPSKSPARPARKGATTSVVSSPSPRGGTRRTRGSSG